MLFKALILSLSATLCVSQLNDPNIFRPCRLNDISCIGNSLRSSSRCQPAGGFVPPVYTVPQAHFDTPAFNASYTENNLVIKGLDRCFVSEYYLNRRTNGRVLALDCPFITFESNRVMYQHYLRSEDGLFRYFISGTYPLITLQLSSWGDSVNLCESYASAYVHALPNFNISPFDRPTQSHLTRDLAALSVFEQETFSARAQLLTRIIVNNKFCNFGCN